MIIMKVFILIAFFSLSNSKTNFMHNLPLGKYRIVHEKVYSCEPTNVYQFNVYYSKKSLSVTELKGNFTNIVPFDDTLTLDINAASWGSIWGWKPNSIVYIKKNAYRSLKKILGNTWNELAKDYNVPNTVLFSTSAIHPRMFQGTFITRGVYLKELEIHNAPKVYFYGKYKFTIKFKNGKNKILGCVALELSLLRPWENQFD